MKNFREELQQQVIIGDGAMGTYLNQLGYPVGIAYESLNITAPDIILNIHQQYVAAGAKLLKTNTFTAQREKLVQRGMGHAVKEINQAAVRLARQAAHDCVYVVGALGSVRAGKRENINTEQVKKDYMEQLAALLEEGIDGVMLETFYDLEEMRLALQIIRHFDQHVPVICQFAVEDSYCTKDGKSLCEAFFILQDDGADVVGLNCRMGPNGLLRALEQVQNKIKLPLSAFPNAGLPDYIDGRYNFVATAEYMAQCAVQFVQLGVRLIGGCCGTTPEHVAQMVQQCKVIVPILPSQSIHNIQVEQKYNIEHEEEFTDSSILGHDNEQESIVSISRMRHTVIVELDPPRNLDISTFMKGAYALKNAHIDALTLADNSLAVTRMSNMALGHMILEQVNLRPLIHITCRDRNLIGTQSHMMGLHALGIDHVLAVTGDPARFGDLPDSSSVYDMTSLEIIRMIKQLNSGLSFSGKSLQQKAQFVIGGAFNPHVKHLDKAIMRLERKIEAGIDYIMTQPVYDVKLIERIAEGTKHLSVPIFVGIMPLASSRNAEYLHHEVPGIQLSDEVRNRMTGLSGNEGRKEGVTIAKELLDIAMEHFHGLYLVTPFMFYDMTVELTQYVWEKVKRQIDPLYRLT